MKMIDVIRLAKANNPALVHTSNVWASKNDGINPVVTIKKEFKYRMAFVISWACLLSWWGLTSYLKKMPEFRHLLEYNEGQNFATWNIVGISTCFVTAFLIIGTLIGASNKGSFIGTYSSGAHWKSAKRFMKAITFLEEHEFKNKIGSKSDSFQSWDSPEIALVRAAKYDCVTTQELISLARENLKLRDICWRKKEAAAKWSEFVEFHSTMLSILEIPIQHEYYVEEAKKDIYTDPETPAKGQVIKTDRKPGEIPGAGVVFPKGGGVIA